jgi:hypothetical protein
MSKSQHIRAEPLQTHSSSCYSVKRVRGPGTCTALIAVPGIAVIRCIVQKACDSQDYLGCASNENNKLDHCFVGGLFGAAH